MCILLSVARRGLGQRVISASLYGSQEKYRTGLIENLVLAKKHYPNWKFWVYVDDYNMDWLLSQVNEEKHVRVIASGKSEGASGSGWRFRSAFSPDVNIAIFRDLDSRLDDRESIAVRTWISSQSTLHIMRDHPFHSWKIMAGMFGLQNLSQSFKKQLEQEYENWDFTTHGSDQRFLARFIYARFSSTAIVHDSFFRREQQRSPFPTARTDGKFVGESFDITGPDYLNRALCNQYESSWFLRMKLLARDSIRIR